MADTSRARLFFNEVTGAKQTAFSVLSSLLNGGDAASENGWRDYKEAGFLGKTGKHAKERESLKQIWSENLSAFGNTAGGVLIWGFHTRERVPDKLSLAPDCEQLAELLRSWTNDATDPYVAGVEVQPIKSPTDAKAGFVICYVPRSTFGPHQAQWGERTYFIRAQDSNLPCPQPLLRNMFYPRLHARLAPQVILTAESKGALGTRIFLETRIRSLGPATAEFAMVSIEPRGLGGVNISHDNQWELIAPNFLKCRYPLPPNLISPHAIRIRGEFLNEGVSSVFRFFTHNTPVHHATVSFTQQEVTNFLLNRQPIERVAQSDPINP